MIEIYTTPSCPYCSKLKQFLNDEGIDYEEYNVAENRDKAKEMIQQTGERGVPQTIVSTDEGEQAVIGFQPEKIKQLTQA